MLTMVGAACFFAGTFGPEERNNAAPATAPKPSTPQMMNLSGDFF